MAEGLQYNRASRAEIDLFAHRYVDDSVLLIGDRSRGRRHSTSAFDAKAEVVRKCDDVTLRQWARSGVVNCVEGVADDRFDLGEIVVAIADVFA